MDWSAKGKIAVALLDEVYIWDQQTKDVCKLASNKPAHPPSLVPSQQPGVSDHITAVRYNQDGSELAVAQTSKQTDICNLADNSLSRIALLDNPTSYSCSLAWNRHILACGNKDGAIVLWDTRQKSCSLICTVRSGLKESEICGLEWSTNERYLASGSDDGMVSIWDVRRMTKATAPFHSFKAHVAAAKALDW